MIALLLSLFFLNNTEQDMTNDKDCGCKEHTDDTKKTPCSCAARRKKIIIIGLVVLAVGGGLFWAYKSGKLDGVIATVKSWFSKPIQA
jgi:hypothetical protein